MDRTHSPEFTMLEFYQAFADYEVMLETTQAMLLETVLAANGKLNVPFEDVEIDGMTVAADEAWPQNSSISRVLPMPGSPASSTTEPRPFCASPSLRNSVSYSACRPTNGSLRSSAIGFASSRTARAARREA